MDGQPGDRLCAAVLVTAMTGCAAPQTSASVLSPSDIVRLAEPSGRSLRVGGRLIQTEDGWQLADALTRIAIEAGQLPCTLRSGDIGVFDGLWVDDTLHCSSGHISARAQAPTDEFQRLTTGQLSERLVQRDRALRIIRQYFHRRDFLEVDTPVRTSERCLEEHIQPIASEDSLLITSPELHMKRLLVGGMPRIFQLVHCFRGKEQGPLHRPEFLMLEWYRAFGDQYAVMDDTEELLKTLCEQLRGSLGLRLADDQLVDLEPPFERLTVNEAFAKFAGEADAATLAERNPNQYFQLLVDRVEPALAQLPRPVFLCEYPRSQAALAQLSPRNPMVADRFELYLGGVELCNGYSELNDATQQRTRMEQSLRHSKPGSQLPRRFLRALDEGMPPAGGNALGVDRLLALLTGQRCVADVMPFAETPP